MKISLWKHQHETTSPLTLEPCQRPNILTILLSILTFLALLHFIAVTHSAYPTIVSNTCDQAIRHANYTHLVSVAPTQEMSAVQFTDTLTGGLPSAMIQVAEKSGQQALDVYIYGCSMQHYRPVLGLLFKQQGLAQGTAAITQAHTLSIGQLDTTLISRDANFLLPQQKNVYHEYAWEHGMLKQIFFPGLYPVISRSEAEALQEQATSLLDSPWKEPLATAEQMAQDLLKWPMKSFRATELDANDDEAHVRLIQFQFHGEITVSLARLVQRGPQGIWFVTGAHTAGITLDQDLFHQSSGSPMIIQGHVTPDTMQGGKASITATLFDHTMSPITTLNKPTITIQANGSYTGKLFYDHPLPAQPGLLLLEILPSPSASAQKRGQSQQHSRQKTVEQLAKQQAGQLLLISTSLGS